MAEKTAAGLVAWCKENLGAPYWYATFGNTPTGELLAQKAKQYPYCKENPFYGPADMPRYRAHIGKYKRVFDCCGLVKGYIWLDEKTGKPKYNASQDKSADGLRAVSKPQCISTIPEIPGVLVFKKRHVGVYIGGGWVVECRWGSDKRTVKTRLKDVAWTHWGYCPHIKYPDAAVNPPAPDPAPLIPQVGGRVRIRSDAVHYYPGGVRIPGWLKGQVKTVDQVLTKGTVEVRGGEQCVLIDIKGVNSWISVKNVEVVR